MIVKKIKDRVYGRKDGGKLRIHSIVRHSDAGFIYVGLRQGQADEEERLDPDGRTARFDFYPATPRECRELAKALKKAAKHIDPNKECR
ncbi:hypothetical protein SEA_OCTOBIEN14_56 [Gordonia phage Octobien14]|uniref:Uncharacterized protein n=1 Tax=Gordonia phage Octobien14 TaxID=2483673 RepID=A0A3G3M9M9_9CAUD|nr:hypothetical protein L3Y22_gp056 [Gordonia phage Octobien14]AYR03202.1 hypothetical protein SEA_OCTOBIEN14_56 [Gordonia phage Octobien14]